LHRKKSFESVTIAFQVSNGFRISGKVPDSVGCGFGTCHMPSIFNFNKRHSNLWPEALLQQ